MRTRMFRLFAVALAMSFALSAVAPTMAAAHHEDGKQNRQIKRLQNRVKNLTTRVNRLQRKTRLLTNDGTLYEGATLAFNVLNFECLDDDDARFYEFGEFPGVFFLDCESFQTPENMTRTWAAGIGERRHAIRALVASRS
jgi:hypothetical protein